MKAAVLVLLLQGCAGSYQWYKADDIDVVAVKKIETPFAAEFCSFVFGPGKRGCGIPFPALKKCVILIRPGDGEAAAHEAGGHCMGYAH